MANIQKNEENFGIVKKNDEAEKQTVGFFQKLSRLTTFFFFFLLLSFLVFFVSDLLIEPYKHQLKDLSLTIFAICSISLIYEFFLREQFIVEMKETVEKVIKRQMPSRYTDIKNSGIVDVYERIDREKLTRTLKSVENTVIRIQKIYMTDMKEFENILFDAVENRGCEIRIMVLNPDSAKAIEARAEAVPYSEPDEYVDSIKKNIKIAKSIKKKLSDDNKDKFQLRLHDSFVAVSLIGYGETFIVGLYLYGRLAVNGTQLKVCESSRYFYNELSNHFNTEWDLATPYEFKETPEQEKVLIAESRMPNNSMDVRTEQRLSSDETS